MIDLATLDQSSKPVWLLDVDGVVNCWPAPSFLQLVQSQDWDDAVVRGHKIWWSRALVSFINEVASAVQPVWLTTWGRGAADLLAPRLGLPDFPVIEDQTGDTDPNLQWWKLQRVEELRAWLGPDRSMVWTDDHAHDGIRAECKSALGENSLLLQPESNPGLTPLHCAAIKEFVGL